MEKDYCRACKKPVGRDGFLLVKKGIIHKTCSENYKK